VSRVWLLSHCFFIIDDKQGPWKLPNLYKPDLPCKGKSGLPSKLFFRYTPGPRKGAQLYRKKGEVRPSHGKMAWYVTQTKMLETPSHQTTPESRKGE
jgi:hypothetical protein